MHLVLVGLPGAGKSTVGRALAERLGRPFVDLDAEVERQADQTIAEIFRDEGEERFRELEVEVTRRVLELRVPAVVAAGGGWASNARAVALLSPASRIIHLRVSPERALERQGDDVAARPLIAGRDSLAALRLLAGRREADYAQADVIIDTEDLALQDVILSVLRVVGGVGSA